MAPVPQVPPPRGWRWVSEWEVDTEHREDLDGWSYARRFRELVHPPPTSALRPKRLHFVRFRRAVDLTGDPSSPNLGIFLFVPPMKAIRKGVGVEGS
eukprot:566078-Prorocentrum_minimum.AAC.4